MECGLISSIVLIFILNVITTCLSTLKASFISRELIRPAYLLTFVDAMIFMYALKLSVTGDNFVIFSIAFALGKVTGVHLANVIDNKIGFGLVEVTAYKHFTDDNIALADRLRDIGYSVTTTKGYGADGKDRLVITIISHRKHLANLKEIIEVSGAYNITVKPLTTVTGKLLQEIRR